jgi:poly(glycerol-phosphate) alpha-glucosyltransferase
MQWDLVIAGWGDETYERELRRLVQELHVDRTVRFVGPQVDRAKDLTYACADAFILPSLSEGLPMTVLEAWAWQLPVLMTNACNLPEGFSRGAAIRISPDAESIKSQLIWLFRSDVKALQEIGVRGRSFIDEQFTWLAVTSQFASLYKEALEACP